MNARGALGVVATLAAIAYPALIYIGLTRWSSRLVALVVIAMAALTAASKLLDPRTRAQLATVLPVPISVATLAALSAVLDSAVFLLFTPVLISLALLAVFGATLRPGAVPMIERFARLQDPDLTEDKVAWCRGTTLVWCGFFVFNGAVAGVLATSAPLSWWTFYTGIVAYALMGLLFFGEMVWRRFRFGMSAVTP